MRIPLLHITQFEVAQDPKDKVVILTVRRSFGFAIEFVIEDSPLMVERFLSAFELAFGKTEVFQRIRAEMTPPSRFTPPATKKKSGPTFPVGKGVERPRRRNSNG